MARMNLSEQFECVYILYNIPPVFLVLARHVTNVKRHERILRTVYASPNDSQQV